jgi:hypothetical protein
MRGIICQPQPAGVEVTEPGSDRVRRQRLPGLGVPRREDEVIVAGSLAFHAVGLQGFAQLLVNGNCARLAALGGDELDHAVVLADGPT